MLSLLPHNKIKDGLDCIQQIIDNEFAGDQKWNRFLKHYKKTWLEGITAEVFSVYNTVERTNNYFLDYHKILNGRIGSNPDTCRILSK